MLFSPQILVRTRPPLVVATTWSPTDKNANITLTDSPVNLVAAKISGADGYDSFRSAGSFTGRKVYFEVTVHPNFTTSLVGIGDAGFSLASYVGVSNFSIGYFAGGNVAKNDGTVVATYAAYSQFPTVDIISVAVDAGAAQKIWFAVNGVYQSGDPSAGTVGLSISTLTGPFFAAGTQYTTGGSGSMVANFGATSYTYTVPTGFGNI